MITSTISIYIILDISDLTLYILPNLHFLKYILDTPEATLEIKIDRSLRHCDKIFFEMIKCNGRDIMYVMIYFLLFNGQNGIYVIIFFLIQWSEYHVCDDFYVIQ